MQWYYIVIALLITAVSFSNLSHNSTRYELAAIKAANQEIAKRHEATQKAYDAAIMATVTEYDKEIKERESVIASRDADIIAGTKRLSVATSSCRVPDNRDTEIPTTKSRAELEPAAARRIIRITDDGDKALIRCNALIDIISNTVRK